MALHSFFLPLLISDAHVFLFIYSLTDEQHLPSLYKNIRDLSRESYRAIDSEGNTLQFLLSPTRDAEAAKRFFVKALHATAGSAPPARPVEEKVTQPAAPTDLKTSTSAPRVINVEKNAVYPKAIASLPDFLQHNL